VVCKTDTVDRLLKVVTRLAHALPEEDCLFMIRRTTAGVALLFVSFVAL